jgi:hypothetical protein
LVPLIVVVVDELAAIKGTVLASKAKSEADPSGQFIDTALMVSVRRRRGPKACA